MELEEKIQKLDDFKNAVIKLGSSYRDQALRQQLRTYINQNTTWVNQEVVYANCFHSMTISPPPAVGGLIAQNVNPFLTLFDPPYGIDMIPHVMDMIDRTIGVLRNPPPKLELQIQQKELTEKTAIFIVHGRDDLAKTEAARFIEKLGLNAIILHEQANSGKTIIEKIEEHTNVGFAIVLYTPCDIGGLTGASTQKSRARQNVVFEHGYLIGKLGRQNVCALVKGDIDLPTDISGVVYITLDSHSAWHMAVAKELRNSGYMIDANKIL